MGLRYSLTREIPGRSVFMISRRSLVFIPLVVALAIPSGAQKSATAKRPRASSLDQNAISYIRPGITVKVVSAAIAQDGTITARVKIADRKGVPLDMDGLNTPGAVTLRL